MSERTIPMKDAVVMKTGQCLAGNTPCALCGNDEFAHDRRTMACPVRVTLPTYTLPTTSTQEDSDGE